MIGQVLEIVVGVVEKFIKQHVNLNKMQFDLISDCGTADAIQELLQEYYPKKDCSLVCRFWRKLSPVKSGGFIFWALRKTGVVEWFSGIVQSI